MSLSISGIGAVQPVYMPVGAPVPYAPNSGATDSAAATTAGAETGAASVVYEPGPSDAGEQYTYPNPETANRAAASAPPEASASETSVTGDAAVVRATGGAVLPPPQLPETPHAAEVNKLLNDVWAPVGPVAIDPAAANAAATPAPVQVGQAEASAQASYAAVADAMITGAPLADLEKFG